MIRSPAHCGTTAFALSFEKSGGTSNLRVCRSYLQRQPFTTPVCMEWPVPEMAKTRAVRLRSETTRHSSGDHELSRWRDNLSLYFAHVADSAMRHCHQLWLVAHLVG